MTTDEKIPAPRREAREEMLGSARSYVANGLRCSRCGGLGIISFLLAELTAAEALRDHLIADADWRHRWHERLGRGEAEPEGKFYERLEAGNEGLTREIQKLRAHLRSFEE